jgi:hypothetical protein
MLRHLPVVLLSVLSVACSSDTPDSTPVEETPTGALEVSATSLYFGSISVGQVTSKELMLSNVGDGSLELYDIAFSDDSKRVHWSLEGWEPQTLDSKGILTVSVQLHPVAIDDVDVNLLIHTNDPLHPDVSVGLSAVIQAPPQSEITPTLVNFGDVAVGAYSDEEIHIANFGSGNLNITGVTLQNTKDPSFSIILTAAGTTLTPDQENGLIVVRFSPWYTGAAADSLVIESNDPADPSHAVGLQGNGVESDGK